MDAIAERAGVHKPTVYRLFRNRENVAVAVIDLHFRSLVANVWDRIGNAATIEQYVRDVIAVTLEFERKAAFPIRSIANGMSGESLIDQTIGAYQRLFCRYWADFLKSQGAAPGDAKTAAYIVEAMVYNALQLHAHSDRGGNLQRILKDMVLGAIRSLGIREQRPVRIRPSRRITSLLG
jgi:AcrR family transcriptional regulator